jgi:F-type H+-transporting ATPase subunit b
MEFISFSQFLWQVFNFLLFYFIVARYVVPPVQKMLADRQKEIEGGLEYAKRAKLEYEESNQKREELLREARLEGARIVEEAKKRAGVIVAEAKEIAQKEAQLEAQKVIASAETVAKARMENLDKEVIELALEVLEKSMRQTLGDSHELVKREVSQLHKVKEYIA